MLVLLMTGFSSGLPLLLTGSTLKFWMREEGLDLSTIGFFGLVGLPYTLKFVWAPLMDHLIPPAGLLILRIISSCDVGITAKGMAYQYCIITGFI